MITESGLNSKNKGQVVAIALDLSAKLDAMNTTPLTAAQVESMMLNLKKQANEVALKSQLATAAHIQVLAQIEADNKKEVTKLQLDYDASAGVGLKELVALHEELQNKVIAAEGDLTFGLKAKEIQVNEALENIRLDAIKRTDEAADKVEKAEGDFIEVKNQTAALSEELRVKHDRTMEQNKYDNSIAERDQDVVTLKKVADKNELTLITTEEFSVIEAKAKYNEDLVQKQLTEAVSESRALTMRQEGAKFSQLKNSTDNTIALLTNDNTHMKDQLASADERIEALEERLKQVPSQIKDAVEAAKSTVNNNIESGKK